MVDKMREKADREYNERWTVIYLGSLLNTLTGNRYLNDQPKGERQLTIEETGKF